MDSPRWLTVVFVGLIVLLLAAALVVPNSVRLARYFLDRQQYGKPESRVREPADVRRRALTRNATPLEVRERLAAYRRHLERMGRFSTWPYPINFDDAWTRRTFTAPPPPSSRERSGGDSDCGLWFVRREQPQPPPPRHVLVFVHGGGLIAGAPEKRNNVNWLATLGWLAGDQFTDLVSPRYRLHAEGLPRDSLEDCMRALELVLAAAAQRIASLTMVGFSAGGMLAVQCAAVCDHVRAQSGASDQRRGLLADDDDDPRLFGVDTRAYVDSVGEPLRRSGTEMRLYLVSPLCRLDRLFMNARQSDASNLLDMYTRVAFAGQPRHEADPLFQLAVRRIDLTATFERIEIFDVVSNSLSNHAIQLHRVLTHNGKGARQRRLAVRLFSEHEFLVDDLLAQKIATYDMRRNRGRRRDKYTRDLQLVPEREKRPSTRSRVRGETIPADRTSVATTSSPAAGHHRGAERRMLNAIHYHMFMFIILCQPAWDVMESVLLGALTSGEDVAPPMSAADALAPPMSSANAPPTSG